MVTLGSPLLRLRPLGTLGSPLRSFPLATLYFLNGLQALHYNQFLFAKIFGGSLLNDPQIDLFRCVQL